MRSGALLVAVALSLIMLAGMLISLGSDGSPTRAPLTAPLSSGRVLTGPEAATALCLGAHDLGTPGWDSTYGCGRLDICGALNAAATITSNPAYQCDTPVPASVGGTFEIIER